jgi:hypothetical protein
LRSTADLDLVERLAQGETAGWMGVDVVENFDFDIDCGNTSSAGCGNVRQKGQQAQRHV